jgi:hypothetical protein
MIHMSGGYDSARGGALFEQNSESRITSRLSVRAGFGYGSTAQAGGPYLGLKVDALRQEHHGVDVAFAGGYEFDSFNRVPAARLAGAMGRLVGATRLLANVAYGQGMQLDERHADVRVAALRPFGQRVHLGVDSRVRLDLERDASEPAGEPEWDLMAGPHAAIALKTFVISATAGAAAVRFREGGATKVGALVSTGVGAVF